MMAVVGVLLAAGPATRFDGGSKLVASFEGEALVRHAARALSASSVRHGVAIVGHARAEVATALGDLPDEIRVNPDVEAGMSTSVRLGVAAARERGAAGAVFLPGDMPCVDAATVDRVVAAVAADPPSAVVPTFDGRRGNPVAFSAEYFDDLESLTGDVGGRALFERVPVRRVDVGDPGIHRDVDTRADLDGLRQSGCGETRS